MSRSQRRAMIDREEPKLSLVRQCALLGISRSSLYYLATEAGAEDLELMALIDQQYLKTYQNGTEARKGIGAYLAFYNQERPHQALGYRSPGQVFQAVSPESCLLEHPRALPSDEGLRDTPAVDSLILASPLS